tara:strand:+ start:823 stop:1095 length:273 start_codon:yes stop_codon:yes gene_type:complete
MPLKKCSESQKSGWKWGDSGKCYTGPEGKKKAIRQGISIEGPKNFQKMASSNELGVKADDLEELSQAMADENFSVISTALIVHQLKKKLL